MSGIGNIPGKIPADLQRSLDQIKERLEVLSGDRGTDLDRAVLLRDLVGLNILKIKGGAYVYQPPSLPGAGVGDQIEIPTQPINLQANGLFGGILLDWDHSPYATHDHAEVWRSETDNLGTATFIGTSKSKVYMDYVGDNDLYYYWVRLVSKYNVKGPYNATAGTPGQTTLDPAYLIQSLGNTYVTQTLLDALGTQIRGSYSGSDLSQLTSGLLYQESMERQIQDENLAQQITLLSVGVPGSFDASKIWYFDTSVDGWVSSQNANVSWSNGSLVFDGAGYDPAICLGSDMSPGVSGASYQLVRARIKRVAGDGWSGTLQWKTHLGHGFSNLNEKTIANPAIPVGETETVEWNLDADTDWKSSTITNLRLQLGFTSSDDFEIEWIGVGRNAPGASVAALSDERVARIGADSAEATARQQIAVKTFGNADPAQVGNINSLTSGLLYEERTARSSGDSALASDISAIGVIANSKVRVWRQASAPIASGVGDVWYKTDDNNIPRVWSGSSWDITEDGRVLSYYNTLAGQVVDERNARIYEDGLVINQVQTLSGQLDDTNAAISQEANLRVLNDNNLYAQYTVKIDLNGYVTGYGLASTLNNGTPSSAFVVRADTFKVVYPGYPQIQPFTVSTVNGSSYVGIQGTLLVDGSIIASKIAARTLTADRIAAGQITGYEIKSDTIDTGHLRAWSIDGTKINAQQFNIAYGGMSINMQYSRIQISAAGYTRVTGVNFGANGNYIDYFGLYADPSSLTDANATFWIKTDGSAYFGGDIRDIIKPRAWARFYGKDGSTAYFTRQHNFSAITRIGEGNYQFTFATPMPNRLYVVTGSATSVNDIDSPLIFAPYDIQTYGFKVRMKNAAGNWRDTMLGAVIVFCSSDVITEPPPAYSYLNDPNPPSYGGQIP